MEDSDESIETFEVGNAVHQNNSDRIIRNILKNRSDNDYDAEDRTTETDDFISTTSNDESSEIETSSGVPTTLSSTLLHPVDSLTDLPTTTEYYLNDSPDVATELLVSSSSSGITTNDRPYSYGQGAPNIEHIFFTTLKPPFNMEPLPVWYSPSVAAWSAFRPSHPDYSGNSDVFIPIVTQ